MTLVCRDAVRRTGLAAPSCEPQGRSRNNEHLGLPCLKASRNSMGDASRPGLTVPPRNLQGRVAASVHVQSPSRSFAHFVGIYETRSTFDPELPAASECAETDKAWDDVTRARFSDLENEVVADNHTEVLTDSCARVSAQKISNPER